MKAEEFLDLLSRIYPAQAWPKPLHLLQGIQMVSRGDDLTTAAAEVGTSASHLRKVIAQADRFSYVMGLRPDQLDDNQIRKATLTLGQLLVGRCAERAFEERYRVAMAGHSLHLRDLREGRTDTDYRVYDEQDRPVYRVNIKFHGSRFRRAPEMVGLDPKDCFALATYKIHSALLKQQEERLPYFFAIVGDSEISGESVGTAIPSQLLEGVAYIHQAPKARQRRAMEDRIVDYSIQERLPAAEETYMRILEADWYVLSARRADALLRKLLFDRVFALRIRGFAQKFRAAELDMHFSLSEDLTRLEEFLRVLRDEGPTKVATLFERGEI